MGRHRYNDRANARNSTPLSDSEDVPSFQCRSLPCDRPNTRYMPTLPLTSAALEAGCPYQSWPGDNRDSAHLRRQSARGPYQYGNPGNEPESEPGHDDDALGSSRESFSSPERQGPMFIDDGEYVASESKSNRRRHEELGRRGYRRSELQTLLPQPMGMMPENGGEDDFADANLSMDVGNDDSYNNGYGEYELDGESPAGSQTLSDNTQGDRTDRHSRRGSTEHLEENIFRKRKIANRDSAAARTLIELGGSAPVRKRRLRQGCRPRSTDTAQDVDDEDERYRMCEMETDSLSSRLAQSSSSNRIETRSKQQHNDYSLATKPRYERIIELPGYTLAEDELAQSVIYEAIQQNQLNQLNPLNWTPFARGKKGQHQASLGVRLHPFLFPDSNEEVWLDLTRESEIHGAVVDADDTDASSETRSETRHFPERAQMASNRDADIGGQQSKRASRRQSGCICLRRGQFSKQQFASELEHELDTKDEDEDKNGHDKKEKPEEVGENDDDEDEEREDTDNDQENRNSRSVQSDTDTSINDTIGANPVTPFTSHYAYLTAKAGNKNESERFTEELRSGREISKSPSPFPVPPQTPGSETKCNFSYPRPCTAMERGEHPYPRKVISHIFGRNRKVTQQIPPWIWVYYCRRHYQRARYRAGSDGREWARIQCERVLDLLEAMRKWGMVEGFTVHLRSREVERLTAGARASSAAAAAAASSIGSGGRGRRGGRWKEARGGGRVGTRAWIPADEDSHEDGQPKQETRQERLSVPSSVPNWLVSWVRRHQGKVLTIEQAEELIQRILTHFNVVQAEEVRFPDIEILPVYREGWPPTISHKSADSGALCPR